MKKTFLVVASLFVFGATYAQISIGPKAGVNLSTLTGAPKSGDEKKLLTGYNAGVVLNIGISDIFSIQPELSFSKQGYRRIGTIIDVPGSEERADLNYMNLPVLAKATFGEGPVRGYVNLGPYIGYMMGGKSTTIISENKSSEKIDFSDNFGKKLNRFDFGVAAGGGALFKAGKGDLMLDIRYSLGLQTVHDDVIFEAGRDTNSVLGISVGYLFPIGAR